MTTTDTTSVDLRAELQTRMDQWAQMGHPSIMERFVLRNGKAYQGQKRPKGVRKQEQHMCFRNATRFVTHQNLQHWLDTSDAEKARYVYVEGFAVTKTTLCLPVQHAWVFDTKEKAVIDLTWKHPEHGYYFGVAFDEKVLRAEILKNRVYGLLDTGGMINYDFMCQIDPGLKAEVDQIIKRGPSERFRAAHASMDQQVSA